MAAAQGQRAAGQQKSATGGGHIHGPRRPFKQPQPGGLELALQRTSPEQPEAGGCELAQSRKSTGLEATSNYACASRGRREQQIALIWDTQEKHSWLKLSTTFDATEYSPPWLAKALPRIFKFTSTLSPAFYSILFSLRIFRSSYPTAIALLGRTPAAVSLRFSSFDSADFPLKPLHLEIQALIATSPASTDCEFDLSDV